MKIAKVLIGACAGALLLSGCMTEQPIKQRVSDNRITLINRHSFTVELLSARTMINDDGLLTVDVSALLSRTGYFRWVFSGDPKITVWYHFDWIDAEGNICPPIQRKMSSLPGKIVDFHGVAPEEKYINYCLTISLKGPETPEEAAQQREEVKKLYSESGKVKPAGKSEARPSARKTQKPAAKPAAKEAVKPQAKPAAKEAAKPVTKEAVSEPVEKQQKLTEPFN